VSVGDLYREAMALTGVLLQELEGERGFPALRDRLGRTAVALLEDVAVAAVSVAPAEHLADADERLQRLRAGLALASELGMLALEVRLGLAEQADLVGRGLGVLLRCPSAVG